MKFIKSTVYVYRTTFSTVIPTFLGEWGGGGRLLEGDAYLKLGANLSSYDGTRVSVKYVAAGEPWETLPPNMNIWDVYT